MQVALVSDIHGNLPALLAVVADIRARQIEVVINLGDALSGPLYPAETADFLISQTGWYHLKGNHERQLLTQSPAQMGLSDRYAYGCLHSSHLAWLQALPAALHWDEKLYCCHGSPRSDLEYCLHSVGAAGEVALASASELAMRLDGVPAAVIACGHTHLSAICALADGRMAVNPGSVGLPAYDDIYPVYHRIETHDPRASYQVLRLNEFPVGVETIKVTYDSALVVRQAEKQGRLDWAHALQFGCLPPQGTS